MKNVDKLVTAMKELFGYIDSAEAKKAGVNTKCHPFIELSFENGDGTQFEQRANGSYEIKNSVGIYLKLRSNEYEQVTSDVFPAETSMDLIVCNLAENLERDAEDYAKTAAAGFQEEFNEELDAIFMDAKDSRDIVEYKDIIREVTENLQQLQRQFDKKNLEIGKELSELIQNVKREREALSKVEIPVTAPVANQEPKISKFSPFFQEDMREASLAHAVPQAEKTENSPAVLKLKLTEDIPRNYTGYVEYENGIKHWLVEGLNYSEQDWKKKVEELKNSENVLKLDERGGIPEKYTGCVEYITGVKHWRKGDRLHRLDGPAVEYPNGLKYWFIEGMEYSEAEWKKKVGL